VQNTYYLGSTVFKSFFFAGFKYYFYICFRLQFYYHFVHTVCVLNMNFLSQCGTSAQVRKNLDGFSSPLFIGVRATSAKSPKSTAKSHLDSSFSSFCILKHPKVFFCSKLPLYDIIASLLDQICRN